MTHNTDTSDRELLLALVAAATCIEALAVLLRPLVAHGLALVLTLAGWQPPRPSSPTAPPVTPTPAQPAASAQPAAPLPRRQASAPQRTRSTVSATQDVTEAAGPQLEALPVRELRRLARAAGHRTLARSGRRQQLLEVLA
jgi:hypothetical protein